MARLRQRLDALEGGKGTSLAAKTIHKLLVETGEIQELDPAAAVEEVRTRRQAREGLVVDISGDVPEGSGDPPPAPEAPKSPRKGRKAAKKGGKGKEPVATPAPPPQVTIAPWPEDDDPPESEEDILGRLVA